jgi:uncharacterized protein (DUF362 family)
MHISRRQFVVASGLLAASAIVAQALPRPKSPASLRADLGSASNPGSAAIAVAQGADYGHLLQRAIGRLGGLALLAGQRVVIKPALAWDRGPGQGVNVHPEVLRATLELAIQAGADQVIVFDRTACRSEWAYRVSGAEQVVRDLDDSRVVLAHLGESDFVPLPDAVRGQSPAAETLRSYRVCSYLLEADRVINLASLRQHPTRQVSLAMANLLGMIGGAGADAGWLRHRDAELAGLCAAVRPELTILDASYVVARNGPLGHAPADIVRLDTLVASTDPVAVEAYGSQLFASAIGQEQPIVLPHIALAEQLGLGSATLAGRLIQI